MIEGHKNISMTSFNGVFDRGDDDNIPINHFSDALNMRVDGLDILTREGSTSVVTKSGINRAFLYKRVGEAVRFLILDSSGNLFDSINMASPILTIASMVDFSCAVIYNRCYISPHDRVSGLAGEKLYVYEGTGTAVAAAGTAPIGFTLGITESSSSGNVEAGTRLFAVAFETSSGFITAPGPIAFTELISTGGKKIDASAIPIGGSNIVARHLLCTKMIDSYDGNQDAQSYYFIPNGRIADNTSTTLADIDFFDAQLVSSADYLFDQLAEIPACLGLLNYKNCLVTWNENAYPSIVRCSKQGEPESINGEIGYTTIDSNDGSRVTNAIDYRGALIIFKPHKTRSTELDSSVDGIAYWTVSNIDDGIGAETFGIVQVLDAQGVFTDYFLTITKSGLFAFDGTYSMSLSSKIDSLWKTINVRYLNTAQGVLDPIKKRIYISVPTGSNTYPNVVWVGDFSNGFTSEDIQWYPWSFPISPKSIILDVDYTTGQSVFYYALTNLYKLDETNLNDGSTAINSYVKWSNLEFSSNLGYLNTFETLRLRVMGSGNLQLILNDLDEVNTKTLTTSALSATPGKSITLPINYVAEEMTLTLKTSYNSEWFRLRSAIVFGTATWSERPG